tara:strand:- start:138 stop:302 length:165 start_codon:yes stop_codon:yes gene_type:complete
MFGQLGSELADVPAVEQRKNKPDACSAVARRICPTANDVLPVQDATAITVQVLE